MKFLRRNTLKYARLGKGRPKLQRWRRAVGRHSKIRKNRFGYTKSPRIGFGSDKKERGRIKGKKPMIIREISDISKASKENILVISRRIGAKKKIEIIKKARDTNLEILNVKGENKNGFK